MTNHNGRVPKRALPLSWGPGFLVKLGLIALLDAGIVFVVPVLLASESWLLLAAVVVTGVLINWAYLSPRTRALKWLAPGLIVMAVFVAFPVIYTAYVSLTNWATGNVLTKEQAIERLESRPIQGTGGTVTLDLFVYRNPTGDLRFLVIDDQSTAYFGTPRDRGAEPVDSLEDPAALGAIDDDGDGVPERIGDFDRLLLRDLIGIANQLESLVLDISGRGVAQVQTTSQARLIEAGQRYFYDPTTDALFDAQEDTTCTVDIANFVCAGVRLDPGWRVVIGFDNFANILSNERIRGPFLKVTTWNFAFALLSVLLTFTVGLVLANALQHDQLKGRAFYRSVFIIPWAIPAFIGAIVWRGLLNNQFGQVNRLLETLGIDGPPWLQNPFWAKVAVLLVVTWLGFPYMFLITSGALQAIPAELKDAARVDGAGPARVFRTITLPLLLVSTAPLLIGSFAYNFNNFVLIFLLTDGGPPVVNAAVPLGETDILITFTFDLAVQAGRGQNFALGSAIVVIIFIIVATFSALSFRFTKRLEDVYGNV